MKTYFYIEETPYHPGYSIIALKHELFNLQGFKGSCNVIPARLMMLSYANYLRLCRDQYGATLFGKNHKYPIALFKDSKTATPLIKELNRRAAAIFESN